MLYKFGPVIHFRLLTRAGLALAMASSTVDVLRLRGNNQLEFFSSSRRPSPSRNPNGKPGCPTRQVLSLCQTPQGPLLGAVWTMTTIGSVRSLYRQYGFTAVFRKCLVWTITANKKDTLTGTHSE
jgi:hypothetical protein